MFRFVASLFGCAHRRCTFPMTSKKQSRLAADRVSAGRGSRGTYIVCLDCGKEFAYDWQQMKVGRTASTAA